MAFSFVDGQIDSICPESDDETWAVNIKRGILSAFQNTMTTLTGGSNARERDDSGTCPVRYDQLSGGWGTRKVKKTKDLLGCTDRQSGQTIFQAVQYDAASVRNQCNNNNTQLTDKNVMDLPVCAGRLTLISCFCRMPYYSEAMV